MTRNTRLRRYALGSALMAVLLPGAAIVAGESPFSFGDALPNLTAAERARFQAGKDTFDEEEDVADGLGPVFNGVSCGTCHSAPATGGVSDKFVTRFGRITNGRFDPMTEFGGSLLQDKGIGPVGTCEYLAETVPPEATIVTKRITTPLFGLGLVDAVPDQVFRDIALVQSHLSPATAGRVNEVDNLVTGRKSVGKFGWKCQNPTLLQFSADAYLNEMGITSQLFPQESCPNGNCNLLACDPVPGLEDSGDVEKFADFMTFLAPPPQRGRPNPQGLATFVMAGCASCHLPTLETGRNPVRALDRVEFHPYSDFLLHDMGSLGDGIEQGQARGREMRTAPLWGVSQRPALLHDGRASRLEDAILAHDGQGRGSREAFRRLSREQRAALLSFLGSL